MNQNLACTAAFGAGIGNNLPLAPTGRAGGSYREKALTSGDLAGSLAVPAVFRICSQAYRRCLRTVGQVAVFSRSISVSVPNAASMKLRRMS